MEKQRGRKKGQRQRAEEMKKKATTLEGKESLEGRGKESERHRGRPTVKGPGRKETTPSLKVAPNPASTLHSGTAKKWEAQRGSRHWQSRWVTLETRARETGAGRGDSGGRQGERSAGQRPTTGSPPPGLGRGLGTEAKEYNSGEWGKRVGGTKGSKNEPKEA